MVRRKRSNSFLRFYIVSPKYQPRSGMILALPYLFQSYNDAYAYMKLNDLSFDKYCIDDIRTCHYEVVQEKLIEFE